MEEKKKICPIMSGIIRKNTPYVCVGKEPDGYFITTGYIDCEQSNCALWVEVHRQCDTLGEVVVGQCGLIRQ